MSDEDLVKRLRAVDIDEEFDLWNNSHLLAEAADAIKRLMWERDEYYADRERFTELAFVDLGENPPVSWKERAEAAERKVEKLRAALCCVGNIAHAEGDAAGICDVVTAALAETEKGDE